MSAMGDRRPGISQAHCVDEVQALAEAVLEAAGVAGLGVLVSFDAGAGLRYIYVNDAAAEILGSRSEELLGSSSLDCFAPEAREWVAAQGAQWPAAESARSLIETTISRTGGERIPVEIAASRVAVAGEPAVVTFVRDIRERKQAEAERKLLQAQLASRDRMATLGMLAASVAHEINNPLAYATLNVEAIVRQLRSLPAQDRVRHFEQGLQAARDGLERVASIVHDLQGLSTPNSAERWPVDVREVIDSALNLATHAIGGRARIERQYSEVPALKTDPAKLGQICLNLLFNAAESFEQANAAANVITLRVQSRLDTVTITVLDNGPGIASESLERIFEPFFTTKSRGMGLGLAICQTLAASLGGKLLVESAVGRGASFSLQLPVPELP
ncbi:MAG: ATP-binding protein [Deltaproteobacteria bacterium]